MQHYYQQTNLTIKKYYSEPTFVDYRTQPQSFKTYPNFYQSFSLDDYPELAFLKNIGKVTFIKNYGNDSVELRTNPSAGGLYPCEVYIQLRAIKGLLSGLYHYEPRNNQLTLIHELSSDGIEHYLNQSQQYNYSFLISTAYFRSSWKYEKRSLRYLLLDTGHQIGSIYTALLLEELPIQVVFNFNKEALNKSFSFEGFEFFFASITSKPHKEKPTKALRTNLPHVSACDYQVREAFIEKFYEESLSLTYDDLVLPNFFQSITKKRLQEAVDSRRSVRAFQKQSLTKEVFEELTYDIFSFSSQVGIKLYWINNNIEKLDKGIYKNVSLLKKGNFQERACELALNQKLGGESAVTFIFSCEKTINFVQATILSGFIAHVLYLRCELLNLKATGIGAYFDDETQKTLECDDNILYFMGVGK